ncbi:recombinase family protein [Isoptericola sp. NPDC057191]|uniref:recombinase family protein n=1 Tax=Isoptericola sp. NPDC057191 TaxID=3346041 RepID=UPI00363374B1
MNPPEQAAAIYVRRSSGKIGTNRTLDEQEREARALAEREGLDVVEVYREREGTGASARSGKRRPQWEAALAELGAGERFRTIIVWALDRADRRGSDTLGAMLSRHAATGRRILGVDGTDTGDPNQRLNIIIRGEIAREYSEKLGDNVARTKRYRREEGLWLGGKPPWGLRVAPDGRLEHDPETYPEARSAAEALLEGATLYAVVADLNTRKVTLASGKAWGSNVVRKARGLDVDVESQPQKWRIPTLSAIVRSPGWAGLQSVRTRIINDDGSKGGWPAVAEVYRSVETGEAVPVGEGVITPDERAMILARVEGRTAKSKGRAVGRKPHQSLLGSRLRCAECGELAVRSGGGARKSYRCGNATLGAGRCGGFTCPVEDMDEYVIGRALIFVSGLDPNDPVIRAAFTVWAGEADDGLRAERQAKAAAVEVAKAELARARRLAVIGVLTEEEAANEMPRLREALASAELALAEREAGIGLTVDSLQDLQYLAEGWDDLDAGAQRQLIETLVRRVDVYRAPYRGARFLPVERGVITFVDGTTWPEDGRPVPHPGRRRDTVRKAEARARRAAETGR